MSDWISIKDNKPNFGELVVISRDFGDGSQYEVTVWDEEEERFMGLNSITHWMVLERIK
jgi:hypothetical protein